MQRNPPEGQRSNHKQQTTGQLVQEHHPLASVASSDNDQDSPAVRLACSFLMYWQKGFLLWLLAVAEGLFVPSNGFCDGGQNLLLLLDPGLGERVLPLVQGLPGVHG